MRKNKEFFALFLIGFFLSNLLYYFEEGINSLDFYSRPNDLLGLVFVTLVFISLPFIIFYGWKKNFYKSLLGFVPSIGFLVWWFLIA
ncbi:MAG: hypothetical protein GXO88_14885 [Chlorobi bacterium]|nr:hypothetical protein [Chlorobiota bacterium]